MSNTNTQLNWMDSLRSITILALIVMTVNAFATNSSFSSSENNMFDLWVNIIFTSATRFSIPMVLMLGGAMLFSQAYTLKRFYSGPFKQLLLPLLCWLPIYWIYRYFTLGSSAPIGLVEILSWGGSVFLKDGVTKHFWLLYMLVFLFILTPFVGAFVKKLKPTMIVFLLAAWVLVCSISKDFHFDLYGWNGNLFPKIISYFTYLGYMVLGYYLYNIFYVSRNIRLAAWILYLVTVLIAAGMTFYSSKIKGYYDQSILNFISLNSIFQSFAVFIAIKETSLSKNIFVKARDLISNYGFGLYLVHTLIIQIAFKCGASSMIYNSLISIPLISILTLLGSLTIIYILRKITCSKLFFG